MGLGYSGPRLVCNPEMVMKSAGKINTLLDVTMFFQKGRGPKS